MYTLDIDILDTMTGSTARYYFGSDQTELMKDGDYDPCYIWLEGNFSCDCNLTNMFNEAAGRPLEDEPCCGDRYVVVEIDRHETGEILYKRVFRMTNE